MPSRLSKSSSLSKSSRTQLNNQVTLERVLGFTLSNNCALSLDRNSGHVAYIAGCVVVIRQLTGDRQYFIQSSSKKPLTSVEFSPDGKFIATGESGHQPMVRLWSVADGSQLAEYAGHHFRVVAVRFSPSTRYLVSLGSQEDNTLYVWDRTNGQRVASAKVTNKVNGIAFSPTGQFFVTVGVRHVRYWYLEPRRNRLKETLPLNGRNAILGDLLNNTFNDVCCTLRIPDPTQNERANDSSVTDDSVMGTVLTLIVSEAGQLMQFNDQRYLEKWVDLRTTKASCLSTSGPWVVVGCARGTCLLFESETLQFLAQLPLPHSLGSDLQVDAQNPIPAQSASNSDGTEPPIYPDLLAMKLDWSRSRVICCYADHSFYVWDICQLNNIQRRLSHFYHSRGVWSIDCFVETSPSTSSYGSGFRLAGSAPSATSTMPSWWTRDTFVTCADDGTIRFWSLVDESIADEADMSAHSWQDLSEWRASRSSSATEQLLRIIYTDPAHKYLCVTDRPSSGVGPLGGPPASPVLASSGINDSAAPSPSSPTVPTFGDLSLPTTSGGSCVRTVCISPDCRHLAVGDRSGNLRVYALETLTAVCQIAAHDGEILSLSFFRSDSVPELALLCSASRDRLIHIFDPNQNYSLVQTVADHSAAIFAARIVETEEDGEIRLISCGMDKSLLIRVLEPDDAGLTAHFALEHHLVGRHSQLDAAFTPNVCPLTDAKSSQRRRYLAVACQDRRLRIYNVTTGRPVRCYRGSFNEDGCLVRCSIDPTGSIVATSGSDKQLNLFHLLTGESIATLCGHAELALGLRFLPDLRRLVTVSSDSCIFVWRLAPRLTQHLCTRPGQTKRTQSFTGFPSSTSGVENLHPVAPLRWPRPSRGSRTGNGREDDEDEAVTEPYQRNVSSWTNESPVHIRQSTSHLTTESGRNTVGDEDSEMDLDTEDLLPLDSLPESGFGDVPDTSDVDLHISNDSFSSYQTATSTRLSASSRGPEKPTFYFSVSALPAWARRKLSRRSSVALVPSSIPKLATSHAKVASDCESIGLPTTSAAKCTTVSHPTNRRSAQALIEPSEPVVEDEHCSSDSLNSSPTGSGRASPRTERKNTLMSQSDYGVRIDPSATQPRVTDSRHLHARGSRATGAASDEGSMRSSVISAPTTPFRRDRSLNESHKGRRTVRQPKRHTVSVASGLQQRALSHTYPSGSLRVRNHRVLHESISEMHSPKKTTDDEQEQNDEYATDIYTQPRAHHTIPPGRSSTSSTGVERFFPSSRAYSSSNNATQPKPSTTSSNDIIVQRRVRYQLPCDSTVPVRRVRPVYFLFPDKRTPRRASWFPPGSPASASLPHHRPASLAAITSSRRAGSSQNASNQFQPATNRSNSAAPDKKIVSSGTRSPGSSSVSSDPASESVPSTGIRSTSCRPNTANSTSRATGREVTKNKFTAPTFSSRQRATTNDATSSAKSTAARVIETRGQLKKAVSTISVEQSGFGTGSMRSHTQNDRPQPGSLASHAIHDDSTALRSIDASRSGAYSLGRAVSHITLTSPTSHHRSPLVTRARWLPEPNSSKRSAGPVTVAKSPDPDNASTSQSKPSVRSPTSPVVVRPTELSLTRATGAEPRKSVLGQKLEEQKLQSSVEKMGTKSSRAMVQPVPTILNPDSTQVSNNPQRPIRATKADSSSNSTLEESDKFRATRDALEAVQEALELAVQRCSEFKDRENTDEPHNLNALRALVTNELEWRFAQLRAVLDLSPLCVEPPVARVLLADLVERLIPKLHAHTGVDHADSAPRANDDRCAADRQASLNQWIADSTTEPANTPAEEVDGAVRDEDPGREDYAACDLVRQTTYSDRISWTLDSRAVVSEET